MKAKPQYPEFEGASVLITGGGSGIGAALTEGFVAQGAKVAFIDIAKQASEALAETLSAKYGNKPLYINADLRDVDAIHGAVAKARSAHGPIGILVNNAARDDRHEIEDVDLDYWENNTAINLRHQFFTVQAAVGDMKAAGKGVIINFTSTSYMLNGGEMPAYTSSKAGVVGLTKGLAGKLGVHGIRVNAIAPGWIMTDRQKELWATPEAVAEFVKRQCIKRELQPEELVGPCLFLASDTASAMTAQVIIADGGIL